MSENRTAELEARAARLAAVQASGKEDWDALRAAVAPTPEPAPTPPSSAPIGGGRNQITEAEARSVYTTMIEVAERQYSEAGLRERYGRAPTDPEIEAAERRLEKRIIEVRALAEAAGRPLPPEDPRSPAQRAHDSHWDDAWGRPAQGNGLPAAISEAQVELWAKAGADNPVAVYGEQAAAEAVQRVEKWLATSASPERRTELLGLATANSIVLRSLNAYALTAELYRTGRPQ